MTDFSQDLPPRLGKYFTAFTILNYGKTGDKNNQGMEKRFLICVDRSIFHRDSVMLCEGGTQNGGHR